MPTSSRKVVVQGNGNGRKDRNVHDSWLTPYGEAWGERFGDESEPPWGELAQAMKTSEAKVGAEECIARFRRFLAAADRAQWARPARFIQELGQWAEGADTLRKVSGGRPSVGARALAEADAFIRGQA